MLQLFYEKPPAKVPKLPAEVEKVGAADTDIKADEDNTALPSGFSTLNLKLALTPIVKVATILVELLNETESAVYQIPVEGFNASTCGIETKFVPVIVIAVAVLVVAAVGLIELIVGTVAGVICVPPTVNVPSTSKFVPFNNINLSDFHLPVITLEPAFLCANSMIPSSVPSLAS